MIRTALVLPHPPALLEPRSLQDPVRELRTACLLALTALPSEDPIVVAAIGPGSASRSFVFSTYPAPGSSTDCMRTISAIVGSASANRPIAMRAAGVAVLAASKPVGSTIVTPSIWWRSKNDDAAATNASFEPHTWPTRYSA